RGDLPASKTKAIEIPLEAGDDQGSGVLRCSSLLTVRDRMADALLGQTNPVITIGGDCGVELAPIAHAGKAHPDLALVWFDAHADSHNPATSASGAFHGMVLR